MGHKKSPQYGSRLVSRYFKVFFFNHCIPKNIAPILQNVTKMCHSFMSVPCVSRLAVRSVFDSFFLTIRALLQGDAQ